jgi:hypothetical protein
LGPELYDQIVAGHGNAGGPPHDARNRQTILPYLHSSLAASHQEIAESGDKKLTERCLSENSLRIRTLESCTTGATGDLNGTPGSSTLGAVAVLNYTPSEAKAIRGTPPETGTVNESKK